MLLPFVPASIFLVIPRFVEEVRHPVQIELLVLLDIPVDKLFDHCAQALALQGDDRIEDPDLLFREPYRRRCPLF